MDFNAFLRDLIAQINFFLYDMTLAFHNFFDMIGLV